MQNQKTKAIVTCSQGSTCFLFNGTESDLWKQTGSLLKWVKAPDQVTVKVGDQEAVLKVGKVIQPIFNNIKVLPSRYEKKWLTAVDPETNAYNFYKVIPHNMGNRTVTLGGSYGRIGSGQKDLDSETVIKNPYPSYFYWIRYYEKINSGYQDVSDIMFQEEDALIHETPVDWEESDVVTALYNKLRDFAKGYASSQLDVDFLTEKAPFTKKQVENGWKIWKDLGNSKDVDDFNQKLLTLMGLSPRKVDRYRGGTIRSFLAPKAGTEDEQVKIFADIIEREETLLRSMEASANLTSGLKSKEVKSPFGNIEVRLATEEEAQYVQSHLTDNLRKVIKRIFRVTPIDQEKKFEDYVNARKIQDIKMLWHGSRNANWISIIQNSLMLNPNAIITGKMWGNGIYFAPSPIKSWGYTSWNNAKYTKENSTTAYMGLYKTAYGTPYFPSQLMKATKALLDEQHADCLHAEAGNQSLLMDEIVYFDEDAVCLQYLVEFEE